MSTAREGSRIKVELTGVLETGEVFAVASKERPLEFVIGRAQVFEPIEKAVLGRESGETQSIQVDPDQAFGKHDSTMVYAVPKDRLLPNVRAEVGDRVKVVRPAGDELVGRVINTTADELVIDCNHPLAGRSMRFDLTVLEVS